MNRLGAKTSLHNKHSGMTLLEVLVGFVIFTSSLVAILNYVSNQVYLSHLTEKNQVKASLINDYAALAGLGEAAQLGFASSQEDLDVSLSSSQIDSYKEGSAQSVLVQTQISVTDRGNVYEWSILEIKR
jgi:type II secretory pathway pseudopilin PulG